MTLKTLCRSSRYKVDLTIWFLSSVGWDVISRHVSLLYFLVSNTTCLQPRLSQAFQDWWRPSNRSAISWVSIFTTKSILRHLSPGICICTSVQKYFILIFAPKMARLKSISVYFWRKNSKIQFLPIKRRYFKGKRIIRIHDSDSSREFEGGDLNIEDAFFDHNPADVIDEKMIQYEGIAKEEKDDLRRSRQKQKQQQPKW